VARRKEWEVRVGELAVYPGQGVTRIEALQRQEIAGEWREFLVLRKLDDQSRILIPRERVRSAGLRAVIGRRDIQRVWEILREQGAAAPDGSRARGDAGNGGRAFRDYQERLRQGSVLELAALVRDLLQLQLEKELSLGERRVLDAARSLLVQELAAAQRKPTAEVDAEIRETLK
jgi:CarD family transcriptional regulator